MTDADKNQHIAAQIFSLLEAAGRQCQERNRESQMRALVNAAKARDLILDLDKGAPVQVYPHTLEAVADGIWCMANDAIDSSEEVDAAIVMLSKVKLRSRNRKKTVKR